MMKIIKLDRTDSTNTWAAAHEKDLLPLALVYCEAQTSGRGQRGNSWESEPGNNITASIIFQPEDFKAADQFFISEAIALAITDFLKTKGVNAKVKWPNDIYVGDKKICGILVEHTVTGSNISRTIAGFGLNVNQTKFVSGAPNPVSLSLITGIKYDIDKELRNLICHLESYIKDLSHPEEIHEQFLKTLWRHDGDYHIFYDRKRNEQIEARIVNVGKDGILILKTKNDDLRNYAFKEVEFII